MQGCIILLTCMARWLVICEICSSYRVRSMEDVGVDFMQTKIEVMYTVTRNSMIAMKGFIFHLTTSIQ